MTEGKVDILPVYYKTDLMRSFGCKTEVTLLRRLAQLGIKWKGEGKNIYVLYEDIREAFKQVEVKSHYHSSTTDILSEL